MDILLAVKIGAVLLVAFHGSVIVLLHKHQENRVREQVRARLARRRAAGWEIIYASPDESAYVAVMRRAQN